MFSKRHYEAIAAVIRREYAHYTTEFADEIYRLSAHLATLKCLANTLADEFASDNPRFDRERFLTACGLTDDPEA